MNFERRLSECAEVVEKTLKSHLAPFDQSQPVVQAMAYALTGGKRLRAFLVLEGARLHGVAVAPSADAAAAVEAIHAYSLVHDDLPCMDDDDLRRGQPTVHRTWGEATAVLAGDALQSLAFHALAGMALPAERVVELVATLADAAGAGGMVLGQGLDIAAETAAGALTLEDITELQSAKTGALIEWSATAGPRMAGADTGPLQRYGECLGLAFQIADDILDVVGDEAKTGKRVKKDAEAGKATFVSLLGTDGARGRAEELVAEAEAVLASYGEDARALREAARFVISREF